MRLTVSRLFAWFVVAGCLGGSVFAAQPAAAPRRCRSGSRWWTSPRTIRSGWWAMKSRKTESDGIASRLKARALAIGGDR